MRSCVIIIINFIVITYYDHHHHQSIIINRIITPLLLVEDGSETIPRIVMPIVAQQRQAEALSSLLEVLIEHVLVATQGVGIRTRRVHLHQ